VIIGYAATVESVQQLKTMTGLNAELSHVTFQRAVLRDEGKIDIVPEPM
jgi:hypothetical protein